MDKTFIADRKQALEEEQRRLRQELGSEGKELHKGKDDFKSSYPEFGADEDENAAEVSTYNDRLSVDHDLESELQNIDRALAAIEAGTYGTCSVCGLDIDADRLRAVPSALTCIQHKNEEAA